MDFFDQTLQFTFLLAHVPGVENPAADYLSRLEIRPEDRVHLKLTDTIPIHRINRDRHRFQNFEAGRRRA